MGSVPSKLYSNLIVSLQKLQADIQVAEGNEDHHLQILKEAENVLQGKKNELERLTDQVRSVCSQLIWRFLGLLGGVCLVGCLLLHALRRKKELCSESPSLTYLLYRFLFQKPCKYVLKTRFTCSILKTRSMHIHMYVISISLFCLLPMLPFVITLASVLETLAHINTILRLQ